MSVPEQIVLYQELAAYDAPRLVLAFVGIHHAASTLLAAGSDEQRRRHLPSILDCEIWVQGFSEPEAGSDLASLRTSARRIGDSYVVNGQKLWASGGVYADWCLLLARTDPDAPKRKGISYFLLDMTTPGVEVRPIRNAIGDSAFCEIFLNDVSIPTANLVGVENAGWQVAQATLGAERGLTMLELAERLGNAGLSMAGAGQSSRRPDRGRPAGAVRNRDRRAARVVPEGVGGQRGRDGRPR
jgi:alkylation response protein AidB-like acyl-CoA dehydrogenase